MTLKAVLDNLDEVDEAFKGEYKELDGKFFLDVDDSIKMHTAILPLSNSLKNVKTEKATLQSKLNVAEAKAAQLPENFDKDEYDRLVAEEARRKADPNYKPDSAEHLQRQREQYETRIASLTKDYDAKLAEKDEVISELDGEIVGGKAETELTTALQKHGVDPAFLKASRSMLQKSVKVIKDEDTGERRAVVETDLGEVDVDKFVENWSKSDEGKPFVSKAHGSGATGTGKSGSTETNPWDPKTKNLTAQGAIIRADKGKAERLMKAASLPQHAIDRALGR